MPDSGMNQKTKQPTILDGQVEMFGPAFSAEFSNRRAKIHRPCWLDYSEATRIFTNLKKIYDHPETDRPPSCVIYGETNSGKTSLTKQFVTRIMRLEKVTKDDEHMPILYIQAPPTGSAKGIYSAILRVTGAVYQPTWTFERLEDQVVRTLKVKNTRMLVIDEMQCILFGRRTQQRIFLNVLKHLSNELRLSIVAVGVPEVVTVLQTNQQWGSRFTPERIAKWTPGREYAKFLHQIAMKAGLKNHEEIVKRSVYGKVLARTNGLTGEAWSFMCKLADTAWEQNHGEFTEELMDDLDWTTPRDRRKDISRHRDQDG